jgi:hypothetical protein
VETVFVMAARTVPVVLKVVVFVSLDVVMVDATATRTP